MTAKCQAPLPRSQPHGQPWCLLLPRDSPASHVNWGTPNPVPRQQISMSKTKPYTTWWTVTGEARRDAKERGHAQRWPLWPTCTLIIPTAQLMLLKGLLLVDEEGTAGKTLLLPIRNRHGGEAALLSRAVFRLRNDLPSWHWRSPSIPPPCVLNLQPSDIPFGGARTAVWQGWTPGLTRQLGPGKNNPQSSEPWAPSCSSPPSRAKPSSCGRPEKTEWTAGNSLQPHWTVLFFASFYTLRKEQVGEISQAAMRTCITSKSAAWVASDPKPLTRPWGWRGDKHLLVPRGADGPEWCRRDAELTLSLGLPCRTVLTAAQQQGLGSGLPCCSTKPQHIPEHL